MANSSGLSNANARDMVILGAFATVAIRHVDSVIKEVDYMALVLQLGALVWMLRSFWIC